MRAQNFRGHGWSNYFIYPEVSRLVFPALLLWRGLRVPPVNVTCQYPHAGARTLDVYALFPTFEHSYPGHGRLVLRLNFPLDPGRVWDHCHFSDNYEFRLEVDFETRYC